MFNYTEWVWGQSGVHTIPLKSKTETKPSQTLPPNTSQGITQIIETTSLLLLCVNIGFPLGGKYPLGDNEAKKCSVCQSRVRVCSTIPKERQRECHPHTHRHSREFNKPGLSLNAFVLDWIISILVLTLHLTGEVLSKAELKFGRLPIIRTVKEPFQVVPSTWGIWRAVGRAGRLPGSSHPPPACAPALGEFHHSI